MSFQVSLVNSGTQTINIVRNKLILEINDESNYFSNIEDGHDSAHFNAYYQIIVTDKDDNTYTFSALAGGDELISAPSTYTVSPIQTDYTYASDGVYAVNIIAVPSWQALTAPEQWDVDDCCYSGGILYKCILVANDEVVTNTTYWEVITVDDLSSKYSTLEYVVVACDLQTCYQQALLDANCGTTSMICKDSTFCDNPAFLKAVQLFLILESLQTYADLQDWDKANEALNLGNSICCDCN